MHCAEPAPEVSLSIALGRQGGALEACDDIAILRRVQRQGGLDTLPQQDQPSAGLQDPLHHTAQQDRPVGIQSRIGRAGRKVFAVYDAGPRKGLPALMRGIRDRKRNQKSQQRRNRNRKP